MFCPEKEAFFDDMDKMHLALTYGDVLVDPGRGEGVDVAETDITSRFSRNVDLKIPMVSAAMDTVTTSRMAIAMAELGGLGVIGNFLSAEEQKRQVRAVKMELTGLIDRPVTVTAGRTIESVLNECERRPLKFRTFPVVDDENRLLGILAGRDIEFNDNSRRRVKSVMTPLTDVVSVPVGTTVDEAYQKMTKRKVHMLPVIDSDRRVQGLYLWSNVRDIVRGNTAPYNVDDDGRLRVAAAISTDEEGLERVREMRHYLDVVVLDTAHGDNKHIFEIIEKCKSEFPDLDVVAGNVSVGDSARDLVKAGADGIKVGQGPGSICTTRIETGIGRPQVTAVYDCVRAIDELGEDVPVCADGGITNRGDLLVAFAAGAHSVMMGSMLAGTDEAPGEIEFDDSGTRKKLYRGMGSPSAMRDSAAARKRYGGTTFSMPIPEGRESLVPYKGSLKIVIGGLTQALRKGMSYRGAPNIEYVRQSCTITRITERGLHESYPHDVQVI